MSKQLIIIVLMPLILAGCNTTSHRQDEAEHMQERQRMITQLQVQRTQIERLRNRQSVMKTVLERERQTKAAARAAAPQTLYNQAKELHKSGQHSHALKQLNQFLKTYASHPLTPMAMELKADTLEALRLPELAGSIWQEILLDYPRSSAAQRAQQILKQAQRSAD